MEIRYYKHYSSHLNRDMEIKVYGHGGKPVLFIPCQGGRFFDFENFHMLDHWAGWIEAGRCTVYACDCTDNAAWAAKGADNRWRIENHERWFGYITQELVPYIKHLSGERNGYDQGILTFGASMGAMHAANLYYRRPVYNNCPVFYLANMSPDHPWMDMYNHQKSLIVCGQGAWEDILLESTRKLDTVCAQKGIHTRFEYWGYDVNHDWPWWFKMVETYLPWFLG